MSDNVNNSKSLDLVEQATLMPQPPQKALQMKTYNEGSYTAANALDTFENAPMMEEVCSVSLIRTVQ